MSPGAPADGPLLVLVGPPGAGKTTVGRLVAEQLDVPFADTDDAVVQMAGRSVSDIFIDQGEARFRELEKVAVLRALEDARGVLALGGGAVLDDAVRAALAGRRVVLLDVGLADAARRVGLARDRPLLLGSPRAALHRLLVARQPLYRQVATVVVPTDGLGVEQVVAATVAAASA